MNRTLTREEILGLHEYFTKRTGGANCIMNGVNMTTLCNMALNSIPKAFDPEDETTWPPIGGYYLARHSNSESWCEAIFSRASLSLGYAGGPESGNWGGHGIGTPDYWMPIPKVGQSK